MAMFVLANTAEPPDAPLRYPAGHLNNNKNKRRTLILFGVLISAGFLWLALQGTDFAQIGEALASSNLWMLAPMLGAYGLFYWVKAIRWRLLLMPRRNATARELFRPMMIGFFGNNVLPAHLGEFLRMHLGAKQLRLRRSEVLATIVLERMFDFLSVVFFLGVVLVLGRDVPDGLITIGYVTAIVGAGCLVGAALFVAWTDRLLAIARAVMKPLPARLTSALLHQLEVAAQGMQSMRQVPLLLGVAITSLVQWAFMGVTVYASLLAVGLDVPVSAAFVVVAASAFGVALPAAPGFFGTVQAAYVLALVPYGVSRADAFAASAYFHAPTYIAVTLLGVWLLRKGGDNLGEIKRKAESESDEIDTPAEERPDRIAR